MKRTIIALTLIAALLGSAAAPSLAGSAHAANRANSHPALFDKTRFVLHMGFAYFAFHHFVWNRYKEGAFKPGAPKRIRNIIKAGIALLFAYHEVKVSYDIAAKSDSKTLHALISPLQKLGTTMSAIGAKFKRGQYSDADVTSLNGSADAFQGLANKDGYGFKDRTVPIPGAS